MNAYKKEYGETPFLIGWDLIKSEDGIWYVIEHNANNPGGLIEIEALSSSRNRANAVLPVARFMKLQADKIKEQYPAPVSRRKFRLKAVLEVQAVRD